MGEHKHNPNCDLAKSGLLPPKKKKLGKRATERLLMELIEKRVGISNLRRADR